MQRRPAGRGGGCAPEPPSSRSSRRPQAAGSRGGPGTQPAPGGEAAAERAPLLAGGAAEAGRSRRDWRGPRPEGAGPLYQRRPSRGAGSRAAGVRRRRGHPDSRLAGGRGGRRAQAAVCRAAASPGPASPSPEPSLIGGEAAARSTPKRRRLWRQRRPQPCCAM